MTQARRSEGPRAPLFYGVTGMFLYAAGALAQSVDLTDLEVCAGLATDELQLACFEAIVASSQRQAAVAAEPADTDSPVPAAQPAVAATIAAPAPETTAAADLQEDFGREHLAEKDDSDAAVMEATVVAVSRGRNRILTFQLDNGQVWRQLESRHFSYPKDGEFDVTISTGMMGDYRLRVGGEGRMLRVRRIQ